MKGVWVFLGVGATMFMAGAFLIYLGLDPTIAVAVVTGIAAAAAQVTAELLGRRRHDRGGPAAIRAKSPATADEPDAEPAVDQDHEPDPPSTNDTL